MEVEEVVLIGLYRILANLGESCYEDADTFESTKKNMKYAYDFIIKFGEDNNVNANF